MVRVILSGTSDPGQIQDNQLTFADGDSLSPEDEDLLLSACRLFRDQVQIPCTACRYCTAECPMEINIPGYLKIYNKFKVNGKDALEGYSSIESRGTPHDCTGCGACMNHCPRGINIPEALKGLSAVTMPSAAE